MGGALAEAIKAVLRRFVVHQETSVHANKKRPRCLDQGLIPLIYYRYHFPAQFAANKDLAAYFLRVQITGVFSGSP